MQRFFVFYKLSIEKPFDLNREQKNFLFDYVVREAYKYSGSSLFTLLEDKDKLIFYCFIIPKDKNEVEDFESKIKQDFEIEDKKEFKKTEDFESYVFDLAKTI